MLPGATFAVPVTVSAFTNITSAQFSLHWNPAVVQFLGVSNFGLTGLDVGNLNTNLATNGMMGVSWDNPSGLGVSLADHTTMFTVSFQAVGANGDVSSLQFADIPTAREVTVGLAPVTFTGQAGSLTVTTAPRFTSVTRSGGRIALVWKTIPRRFYRVEYKDGATDTKWTALGTDIQAFAESVSTTDPVAPNSRFYRVSLLP